MLSLFIENSTNVEGVFPLFLTSCNLATLPNSGWYLNTTHKMYILSPANIFNVSNNRFRIESLDYRGCRSSYYIKVVLSCTHLDRLATLRIPRVKFIKSLTESFRCLKTGTNSLKVVSPTKSFLSSFHRNPIKWKIKNAFWVYGWICSCVSQYCLI